MRNVVIGSLCVAAAIGASGWFAARFATLWWIPIPLAFSVLVAIAVWHRRVVRAERTAPQAPEWHVIDEELPDELSPTEQQMLAATATALLHYPTTLSGIPAVCRQRSGEQ